MSRKSSQLPKNGGRYAYVFFDHEYQMLTREQNWVLLYLVSHPQFENLRWLSETDIQELGDKRFIARTTKAGKLVWVAFVEDSALATDLESMRRAAAEAGGSALILTPSEFNNNRIFYANWQRLQRWLGPNHFAVRHPDKTQRWLRRQFSSEITLQEFHHALHQTKEVTMATFASWIRERRLTSDLRTRRLSWHLKLSIR